MGTFTDGLTQLGFGVAGNLINTGLGIVLGRSQEKHNDARQLAMQQKLQEMQEAGSKRLTDYNFQKQLEMWNSTNYEAQVAHLKAAGLNPALMYGMGGGGGSTASLATGQVSQGHAPAGGHESYDQQGMGIQFASQAMQLQLLSAQKANIEADTRKKEADTKKTAGVDTQETEANIQNLLQGYDNLRQTYELQRLEITAKNLANYKEQASQDDQLKQIHYNASAALRALQLISNEVKESDATLQSKIQIIQQDAIAATLRNTLTQAQIENTTVDSLLKNQQIKASIQTLSQNWQQLDINQQKLAIDRFSATINANFPGLGQATGRILNDAIESIMKLFDTERGYHYQPKKK